MAPLALLIAAAAAFILSHLGMSGRLREPLLAKLGRGPFMALYSLIALTTLGATGHLYSVVQDGSRRFWAVNEAVWIACSLAIWFASILFVGSIRRNPAIPHPTGAKMFPSEPHGVFAITRHPMMWSMAIWALVHMAINPTLSSFILSATILVVALVGSRSQDERSARDFGEPFIAWRERTSFVPFAKGFASPDAITLVIGTALFFFATYAHQWIFDVIAGFWRYL